MWARAAFNVAGGLTANAVAICDLLFYLKNPNQLPNKLIVPEGVTPSLIPQGSWPQQDITGATVKRVRLHLSGGADLGAEGSLAGFTHGMKIDAFGSTAPYFVVTDAADAGANDPNHGGAAQAEDWMSYDTMDFWDPSVGRFNAPTGTVGIYHKSYDVRSQRRISDWGDSLILCVSPVGWTGATAPSLNVRSSVLLALP